MQDQEFQLADVTAPGLFTLQQNQSAYFDDAKSALTDLLSAPLEIQDCMPKSRWGVRRVIVRSGGATLQERLVTRGACRVRPESGEYDFIRGLLALEDEARKAQRGLWSLSTYALSTADSANYKIGAYAIIEGKPRCIGKYGSRLFINFGNDFREDFTATATSTNHRKWKKIGIDFNALEGRMIRVRGWVESINGPSIDLQHPLQIETLDDEPV
ncbi:thermonuclease family protein [Hyphococcus formosus]|uniref:thermonuclease family protein n=1 Tax=Hyphococcus formosus TaxID=3143534 RepID=UPI00398ADF9C